MTVGPEFEATQNNLSFSSSRTSAHLQRSSPWQSVALSPAGQVNFSNLFSVLRVCVLSSGKLYQAHKRMPLRYYVCFRNLRGLKFGLWRTQCRYLCAHPVLCAHCQLSPKVRSIFWAVFSNTALSWNYFCVECFCRLFVVSHD